jgi:hypothetical protein
MHLVVGEPWQGISPGQTLFHKPESVLDRPPGLGGHAGRSIRAQYGNWLVVLGDQDFLSTFGTRKQCRKFMISLTRADGFHNHCPHFVVQVRLIASALAASTGANGFANAGHRQVASQRLKAARAEHQRGSERAQGSQGGASRRYVTLAQGGQSRPSQAPEGNEREPF